MIGDDDAHMIFENRQQKTKQNKTEQQQIIYANETNDK